MTYTRTFTIEERACMAMFERTPVRIVDTGVVGKITAIRYEYDASDPLAGRVVEVLEATGSGRPAGYETHEVELELGALEYL